MTIDIKVNKLVPLLPLTIPALCILIANTAIFTNNPAQLAGALTFDLLITTPVIYFLLIRKRAIPNTTVIPVSILGIFIASVILPPEHQDYLSLVKTWFLPLLEISAVTYLIITIRKAIRKFKKDQAATPDFFSAARNAANSILPKSISTVFATELSLFYYGFINWKKHKRQLKEFTYHKTTGTPMLLGVFVFLIIVEGFAVHLLLQSWSAVAAWILTGLSIYACLQVFGILRSLGKRLISIEKDHVNLRYGVMNETTIPFIQIQRITFDKKAREKEEGLAFLSPFKDMEGTNVIIELKDTHELIGFYGFKKPFQKIALFVDEPEEFVEQLKSIITPS